MHFYGLNRPSENRTPIVNSAAGVRFQIILHWFHVVLSHNSDRVGRSHIVIEFNPGIGSFQPRERAIKTAHTLYRTKNITGRKGLKRPPFHIIKVGV